MKTRSLKQKCSSALMLIAALTVAFSSVSAQEPEPNGATAHGRHTLHGTWRVTITAVDCITGQDILSFPAIQTYNQGGTYTGYVVVPGTDPGQGTEYGVWQREPGSHNYSRRAVSYAYTAEGDFEGRVEITDTLHLTTANSFESSATIQGFDADGNLLFTACDRGTGTRFE